MSQSIRTLSPSMINKIAAGEVVERPASVVKELVENSIDAASTRIDVAIEEGGANLIRIVDNGHGIPPDELPLAISPHATSKIAEADDLFRIQTFGFRGEALASIAEISQMVIRSRTRENDGGAEIRSGHGEIESSSCGMAVGTQIEVRNLFYNTPVRRKYMKSTTTEFGHVSETFLRLVLPHPNIHFTLQHNGRCVNELPPETTPLARIRRLFGDDIAKEMIFVESREGSPVRVSGFVSHPNQSRSNNRMQYFFLNNRFIRDKSLQHAISEAYRGLLTVGRFPLAFLHIEMSPEMFDVNVHPTKMEVRFLDSNKVYTGFLGTIREKFLTTDLSGRFEGVKPHNPNDPRGALSNDVATQTRREITDWVDQIKKESSGNSDSAVSDDKLRLHKLPASQSSSNYAGNTGDSQNAYNQNTGNNGQIKSGDYPRKSPSNFPPLSSSSFGVSHLSSSSVPVSTSSSSTHRVIQLLDKYLVMETMNGIVLIDQHAVHERILFEQLKERMSVGQIESQRLLVPIPVDLSPQELACTLEHLDFFRSLGLRVEPFGGKTVLISSFPTLLAKMAPIDILHALIEPILEAGKKVDMNDLQENILHSVACKAAIKGGDKLREDAMTQIAAWVEHESSVHHCPHGRPAFLHFSEDELDKMFKRQ
ncbi:MAG: DNA mismatch repair endonuclease MutL [Thermoguttaceae bacterium]